MLAPAPLAIKQAAPEELTQLRPEERAALREYLDRLQDRFGNRILRVILYGSRARGEGDKESDLDVLVVVDEGDWRLRQAINLEAFEPSLENNVDLAAQVWSEAEFERHAQNQFLSFRNLERDGKALWISMRSDSMPVIG